MKRKLLIGILFFSALLFFAFLFVKTEVSASDIETSRLSVIQSVVDNGTFDITNSIFKTTDKAEINGRLYGDKPPLLTWISIGEYYFLSKVFGLTFRTHYPLVIFLLNLLYFFISAGVGILFYFGLTRMIGNRSSVRFRVLAAVLSVISTLIFSYSVTICNHTVCAFLLMLLILALESAEKNCWPLWTAFSCGVITGTLFNCEFILGGSFGLGVFIFCITAPSKDLKERLQRGAMYGAGAVLLLVCEGLMNYLTYGSPLPLYLLTHKPDLAQKDYLYYAWNVLFGFEGFFLYMPACLFLFPALFRNFPGRNRVCACMLLCCLGGTILFLLGTSDYGGFCYGYRFLIPIAPVMLFYTFLSFHTVRRHGICTILFGIALGWGVITSYFGTFNPWNSGYEGSLTLKGNFNEKVRNGFMGNVFVFAFENDPDSVVSAFFIDRFYGPDIAFNYLCEEFYIRRDHVNIKRTMEWFNRRKGFTEKNLFL